MEKVMKKYIPLIWLSRVGGICYKKDFYMLLPVENSSRLYKSYIKDGYIVEFEVPKENNSRFTEDTETVVSLSSEKSVVRKLKEHTDLISFSNITKITPASFTTKKHIIHAIDSTHAIRYKYSYLENRIYPVLNEATVRIMFHIAGTRVDKSEKPSLRFLYENTTAESSLLHEEFAQNDYLDQEILDTVPKDRRSSVCKHYLLSGIYYSKEEFRELDRFVNGNSATDVYKSLKWQGIFISAGSTLVVSYASKAKLIKNRRSALENFAYRVEDLMSSICPDTNRILDIAEPYGKSYIQHSIGALVFSNGPHIIKAVATNPHKYDIKKKPNVSYELLDATNSYFSHVFCVPTTYDGLTQLHYITHRSVEHWRREASFVLKKANDDDIRNLHFQNVLSVYEKIDGENVIDSAFFHGLHEETGCDTLFMPVYEAKTLYQLSKYGKENKLNLMILTEKNMIDTISQMLRLGNSFGQSEERIVKFRTDLRFGVIEPKNGHDFYNYTVNLPPISNTDDPYFISSAQSKSYKNSQYASFEEKDVFYRPVQFLPLNEYLIYDEKGGVDGKSKLEAYALTFNKDLAFDSEFRKSHPNYSQLQTSLFNSISKGKLSVETAFSDEKYLKDYGYCFVEHKEKKRSIKERRHSVSVNVSTSTRNLIRENAEKEGITVSKYLRKLIQSELKEKK